MPRLCVCVCVCECAALHVWIISGLAAALRTSLFWAYFDVTSPLNVCLKVPTRQVIVISLTAPAWQPRRCLRWEINGWTHTAAFTCPDEIHLESDITRHYSSGELLVHYLLSKVFSANDLLTSSSSDLLCRVCSTSQLPKTPALFVEDLRIRIWRGCGDPPHKKYSISHNLDNKYICLQNVWKARACHQQHTQSLMIKTCLVFVLMLSTLMWHLFGLRGAHNGFACCARAL